MAIDLSKTSLEDLVSIHNEVLKNIALQTKTSLDQNLQAGHDSHGSNHSNNKITDLQSQIEQLAKQRQQR